MTKGKGFVLLLKLNYKQNLKLIINKVKTTQNRFISPLFREQSAVSLVFDTYPS